MKPTEGRMRQVRLRQKTNAESGLREKAKEIWQKAVVSRQRQKTKGRMQITEGGRSEKAARGQQAGKRAAGGRM